MISVVVVMKYCNYVGFSNIFLQPSFPKEKGVILNDTCRIVLLIALSILETLFLKLGGMYYIEIDKLRDYQQKLNIHHFLSCSIFGETHPSYPHISIFIFLYIRREAGRFKRTPHKQKD